MRALVLNITLKGRAARPGGPAARDSQARLEEAVGLARAIDLDIVHAETLTLAQLSPDTLIGSGSVERLAALVAEQEIGLVVVNRAVSPGQQRNLERRMKAKVLDRTGLILEIFGRRARTREGVLQVELAHLNYQKSRLVRSWTHLERQRGGYGFLGGPGETQLETDRRLIQQRITRIEAELAGVIRTRALHRRSRERVPYPVVALVGYTNAGKSTLFNRLTASAVLAKDLLFATLDPTMREVKLAHGRRIILSDTVGFISDLPTTLIAAFRATLEEVVFADVILHVRDIAHEETEAQAADVDRVLASLDISEARREEIIEAWNKADLLDSERLEAARQAAARSGRQVMIVSALTGYGVDGLLDVIEDRLSRAQSTVEVTLDATDGEGLAWLYARTEVTARETLDDGRTRLTVRADPSRIEALRSRFPDQVSASAPSCDS